jgi:hypothetical protein
MREFKEKKEREIRVCTNKKIKIYKITNYIILFLYNIIYYV